MTLFLYKMVKRRRIRVNDFVTYASREWIVITKGLDRVTLVRREVTLSNRVTVRISRVKHADQMWRDRLKHGDPIEYFLFNAWVPAKIISHTSGTVQIQPSFSNFTVQELAHSSKISKGNHNFPIWQVEKSYEVMYQNNPRLVRGDGLLYPWEYAEGIPLPTQIRAPVLSISFDSFETTSYPVSMYNDFSTDQIVCDLYKNKPVGLPGTLSLLVDQYSECRGTRCMLLNNSSLSDYVNIALEHGDDRRVNELLSVGEHGSIFAFTEYLISQYYTQPVLDMDITYKNGKVVVDIFRFNFWMSSPTIVELFKRLSVPVRYNPVQYEISGSPEISFILSRMLGMEEENVYKLYLRTMGNIQVTLSSGWCIVPRTMYGGVICVHGLNTQILVRELMQLRPLKTLIIVKSNTLNNWTEFSKFRGTCEADARVVVITQHMFVRHAPYLKGFDRVICIALPSSGSYARALSAFDAKTRWAICRDDNIELLCAWGVHGLGHSDQRGEIKLTRDNQLAMGVTFPQISINDIVCPAGNTTNIARNTMHLRKTRREMILSKYLLHPSLVASHYGGERLDDCEGTMETICKTMSLDKTRLTEHLKDTCAVCLEAFETPVVTSCGHVFCAECATELQKRKVLNCPMCRAKIQGYMRVSNENTLGEVTMHHGVCYRISGDRGWGAKMDYLRTYPHATIVSKYSNVVARLKRELPNKDIFCLCMAAGGRVPKKHHVILVEPCSNVENIFDTAYGKDIFVTMLRYMVDLG